MKASHKKHIQLVGCQEIILDCGQFIFGRKAAAYETNMSEQQIRTNVRFLEKTKNITIKSTNKFSIISVVNWDIYQSEDIKINQQHNNPITINQPTNNQQITTNKNVKNVKNINSVFSVPENGVVVDNKISTTPSKNGVVPYEKILALFNEILSPPLPEARLLPDHRKRVIKTRWYTDTKTCSLDWWKDFFDAVKENDLYMGRKISWRADFDALLTSKHFTKIRETG